ncbi:Uncharacterised protein [Raoultella terrigena]|nr:Uncharacterised protein [Raoultella terrigena]
MNNNNLIVVVEDDDEIADILTKLFASGGNEGAQGCRWRAGPEPESFT